MKKYKVLRLINGELISPYQNYNYGKLEDILGIKMVCENFDDNEYKECAKRFYVTDIEGLVYSLNKHKDNRVFEVEMGGRSVVNSEYKQGFEEQTIVRVLSESEVRKLIEEQSKTMDWDYYHACYPVNPLKIDKPFDREKVLKLLKEWDSVWKYVWDSVQDSVWDSMWKHVWDSMQDSVWSSVGYSVWSSVGCFVRAFVGASVGASVRASVSGFVSGSVGASVNGSVRAYISSLFPLIKKWKYINHKEGANPFQSGIDLWNMGLVPSFDGKVWRLHKGEKAEVVLEISREKLK